MPEKPPKQEPAPEAPKAPKVVAEKPVPQHARGLGCHPPPNSANLAPGTIYACAGCSKEFKLSRVDGIDYWRNSG